MTEREKALEAALRNRMRRHGKRQVPLGAGSFVYDCECAEHKAANAALALPSADSAVEADAARLRELVRDLPDLMFNTMVSAGWDRAMTSMEADTFRRMTKNKFRAAIDAAMPASGADSKESKK